MARPFPRAKSFSSVACAGLLLLGGCSGELTTSSLSPPSLALPLNPPSDTGRVAVPATELYMRVARGALVCWFGRNGPLKRDYIYHADAEPPSRGGGADIVIHVRDLSAPSPRGLRAFRILVTSEGTASTYAVENLKMPEALSARMTRDVARWAQDEAGCGDAVPLGGWAAQEVQAPAQPVQTKRRNAKSP
jgi:hypothetical protein